MTMTMLVPCLFLASGIQKSSNRLHKIECWKNTALLGLKWGFSLLQGDPQRGLWAPPTHQVCWNVTGCLCCCDCCIAIRTSFSLRGKWPSFASQWYIATHALGNTVPSYWSSPHPVMENYIQYVRCDENKHFLMPVLHLLSINFHYMIPREGETFPTH